MVLDLTGMQVANASLLDEGTAAAEAMAMFSAARAPGAWMVLRGPGLPSSDHCRRADPGALGRDSGSGRSVESAEISGDLLGVLVQYPSTDGAVHDYRGLIERSTARARLRRSRRTAEPRAPDVPRELGADAAVGSTQRFGIPVAYGGPHAAYFATRDKFRRFVPGRIIGVSVDAQGNRALRMALQTREHISGERRRLRTSAPHRSCSQSWRDVCGLPWSGRTEDHRHEDS